MLKTKHNIVLTIVLVLSFLARFIGLGYSHFYGDETKTFYLDKTIPAYEFFMNQRKGPVQFTVVWTMEKVIGGYDEFLTRFPFALASFLSVYVFYLFVKKIFDKEIALVSTILFSFSGFNLAFSRTIQYQSFLILFGLLSLCLYTNKKYLLSAVSIGLAFLSHYDAVFFLVPLLYFVIRDLLDKKITIKETLVKLIFPIIFIVGVFYIPYIYNGYFNEHTVSYLSRRVIGDNSSLLNYSPFTFWLYNPCGLLLLLLSTPLILFFKDHKKDLKHIDLVLVWLIIPFLLFQFFMTNPGTHIHNYLIPLYILAGYTLVELYRVIKTKKLYLAIFTLLLLLSSGRMLFLYVPHLNTGYPWNYYDHFKDKYQVFIYGFPYYRSWDKVHDYFYNIDERVEGVFTNDNDTIAEYYLQKFDYTPPGSNFLPQYYIHVPYNQQFTTELEDEKWEELFLSNYTEVTRFENKSIGMPTIIYKLKNIPQDY